MVRLELLVLYAQSGSPRPDDVRAEPAGHSGGEIVDCWHARHGRVPQDPTGDDHVQLP